MSILQGNISYVGSLVGGQAGGSIANCYSQGSVSSSSSHAGGWWDIN